MLMSQLSAEPSGDPRLIVRNAVRLGFEEPPLKRHWGMAGVPPLDAVGPLMESTAPIGRDLGMTVALWA
jgi:hypothetical protein